jgi:hypothetical protein
MAGKVFVFIIAKSLRIPFDSLIPPLELNTRLLLVLAQVQCMLPTNAVRQRIDYWVLANAGQGLEAKGTPDLKQPNVQC